MPSSKPGRSRGWACSTASRQSCTSDRRGPGGGVPEAVDHRTARDGQQPGTGRAALPSNRCRLPSARRNVSWARSSAAWGSAREVGDIAHDIAVQGSYEALDGLRVTGSGGQRPGGYRLVGRQRSARPSGRQGGAGSTGRVTWCPSRIVPGPAGRPANAMRGGATQGRCGARDRRAPLPAEGGRPSDGCVRPRPGAPAEADGDRVGATWSCPGNQLSQTTAIPVGGPREVIVWTSGRSRGARSERLRRGCAAGAMASGQGESQPQRSGQPAAHRPQDAERGALTVRRATGRTAARRACGRRACRTRRTTGRPCRGRRGSCAPRPQPRPMSMDPGRCRRGPCPWSPSPCRRNRPRPPAPEPGSVLRVSQGERRVERPLRDDHDAHDQRESALAAGQAPARGAGGQRPGDQRPPGRRRQPDMST